MSEAATIDSSKKEDGSTEAAVKPAMSVDDVAGSFQGADRDTVLKALDQNPDLYQRVLMMSPDELEQLDGKLKQNQPLPGTDDGLSVPPAGESLPAGTPATPAETSPEEEMTVRLKASDLGTYYTKGRSLQEAIVELVKGKRHADDRINFLKNEQLPAVERTARTLSEENQRLQAELEALKKAPAPVSPVPQAPTDPVADEITIPEDLDFYDPEAQKKVLEIFKQVKDSNSALRSEIESIKKGPAPAAPAPLPAVPQAPRNNAVDDEFNQIRMLQRNPDTEGAFSTSIDVKAVEEQNVAFMENLARLSGINSIFDESGRIAPAVTNLLTAYYNPTTPEAQKIRSTADQVGITPPEDLPALNRVYAVRQIRLKYNAKNPITGNVEPISYEEAHRLARAMQPQLFAQTSSQSARSATRDAIARGVEHRQSFAPEPKPSASADMEQVGNMSVSEFNRLMKKSPKDLVPQEIETLRKIFKTQGQMNDDEITEYFKSGA